MPIKRKHADPQINLIIETLDSLVILFGNLEKRMKVLEEINANGIKEKEDAEKAAKEAAEKAAYVAPTLGGPIKRARVAKRRSNENETPAS